MIRIAGIDLVNEKQISIALTSIYGIGKWRALNILIKFNIDPTKKCKDLTDEETASLRDNIDKIYQIEGDLRRIKIMNVKRLVDIQSYRGKRHKIGLPLRGQRTRTNSRNARLSKR
jgi:small subunit ribosomal protein S13|mmetsp:Transcript_777/g.2053  ORF Transcript_777/g.2053 Transcript_777/m.2053 type:complete len:116 (-) Transcript_777:3263-3610(-)